MEDNRPFVVSGWYTISLNEKANLRAILEGWRGRSFTDDELGGFSLEDVLDKPCTLTVIHNAKGDKTYANIASASPLMKGMEVPARVNDLVVYDFEKNEGLENLPEWQQTKVQQGIENQRSFKEGIAAVRETIAPPAGGVANDEFDDDIPFIWAFILPLIPVMGVVGYATETVL